MEKNVVGWFEIPVSDIDRAIKFYEDVFGYKLEKREMGPLNMALFPGGPNSEKSGAAGSLMQYDRFYKPSKEGALLYFNSPSGDLQNELDKVEKNGGEIVIQKTQITEEIGYMGVFVDSEGNHIALINPNS